MSSAPFTFPCEIRDAGLQDLPAIVQIYNSTIASRAVTADEQEVTLESRLSWFSAHSSNAYPIWVCEKRGNVIAWLSFSRFHERPAYGITAEISIYVREDERRQGIGEALVTRAIATAPSLGFECLVGLIFAQNEPSIRMITKLGFKEWGRLPRIARFNDSYRDLVILGLHMSERLDCCENIKGLS